LIEEQLEARECLLQRERAAKKFKKKNIQRENPDLNTKIIFKIIKLNRVSTS